MRARPVRLMLLCILAVAASAPLRVLGAQSPAPPRPDSGATAAMILAGTGMGVAGLLGGAIFGEVVNGAGRKLFNRPCPAHAFCEGGEAMGGLLGLTVGVPLGAHLANHRRGRFLSALAGSAAVMGAGYATYRLTSPVGTERAQNLFIWPTLAAQVAISALLERATIPRLLPAPPLKAAPPSARDR